MHQITYKSEAKSGISPNEILDILKAAYKNNPGLGITGCLVFHNGSFVQVIEGLKEQVFGLYKKIETDTKHRNVKLVWEGSC